MTQAKHTPLFAYKNYVTDKQSFGYDESGARVGETPNIAMDAGTEELARLIAAAPELLEALEEADKSLSDAETALIEYEINGPALEYVQEARAQARAAIAKAKGE